MSDPKETGTKPCKLILYNKEWLTLTELANHEKLKDRNLSFDVLWSRINKAKIETYKELLKTKRFFKKRFKIEDEYLESLKTGDLQNDHEKILINFGYHRAAEEGEIFIGYLSETMFGKALMIGYWKHQKLGIGRCLHGFNKGRRPYFIRKSEAIEKGWKIR